MERLNIAALLTAGHAAVGPGRDMDSQSWMDIRVKGAWAGEHVASFQPLVDRETFNRVQHILKDLRPHVVPNQRKHPDFPLRAFVRCQTCGKPVTAGYSTGKSGDKYGYYHCQNDSCPSKLNGRCPASFPDSCNV
jgi:hypothetical protein